MCVCECVWGGWVGRGCYYVSVYFVEAGVVHGSTAGHIIAYKCAHTLLRHTHTTRAHNHMRNILFSKQPLALPLNRGTCVSRLKRAHSQTGSQTNAHTQTQTHTHSNTHTDTHELAHTQTHTHRHTQTHTHSNTHTFIGLARTVYIHRI